MEKNNSTKIIIAVAAAAAAFLCLCLVVGVAVFVFTRSAMMSMPKMEEPVIVETAVEIPELVLPTSTPEPTEIPTEEPTEEPEPTETAEPLVVDTPVVNSEGGTYDQQIVEKLLSCQSGLTIVSEQVVKLSENKALLSDSEWQGSMILGLAFMQGSCTTFSEITPVPDEYSEGHEYLIMAEEEFGSVITNMTEGMEQQDMSKIQAAAQAMVQAGEYLTTASEKFPTE